VDHARSSLEAAGLKVHIFDRVHENPTTVDVDDCLEAARASGARLFVGFGGGSSLDTAKGANFVLTNGGRMQDYWGVGKAQKPLLPLIAVPTTSGTGSECQSFALIADAETHQKMACGDPKAAAKVALLDPLLTVSQPPAVTACTGIDALSHALETSVTNRRNEISVLYSRGAFRLLFQNFATVLSQPEDIEARAAMQLGAAYAGLAIENSMLGAAHSAANPLTAHFDLVHGLAVGVMLPHIIRYNAAEPHAAETYRELALIAGLVPHDAPAEKAVGALAEHVGRLVEIAREATAVEFPRLSNGLLPTLAAEADRQWTARFNPRSITAPDFERLYTAALS
jgi:alcohol dehydrogenase